MRRNARLSLLFLMLACMVSSAHAAEADANYPNRAIRIVDVFVPGGPSDIIARLLAQKLTESLGQPVIVENRGSAGGIVGAEVAAKAPPDGYTLMVHSTSHLSNAFVAENLAYDTLKDFEPISLLAAQPSVLVTTPSLGIKSVKEFVAAAKGWGKASLMGNVGARVPNNFARETAQLHCSLQVAYQTCRCFTPFATVNSFTVLNAGNQLPLGTEGFDLINFGSSQAAGTTQVTAGAGFRSKLHERVELGFAYERGVTSPRGVFDDRFTVDCVLRF